jgi:hypothetical protein
MAEQLWAVMSGTTCTAVAVSNNAAFAQAQGWLGPYGAPLTFGIGSTTSDNGVTWVDPPLSPSQLNRTTIINNVANRQAQIQAWIAANPAGAVLTAAQTLALAQMLEGLCRLVLGQFEATT